MLLPARTCNDFFWSNEEGRKRNQSLHSTFLLVQLPAGPDDYKKLRSETCFFAGSAKLLTPVPHLQLKVIFVACKHRPSLARLRCVVVAVSSTLPVFIRPLHACEFNAQCTSSVPKYVLHSIFISQRVLF